MNRQLYMGGGIMNAVPREQYGFGSVFKGVKKAVKGATKAVKKIASSDVGKAAITGAVLFGIPGMGATGGLGGGLLGRASFGGAAPGVFGLGGIGNLFGASTIGNLGDLTKGGNALSLGKSASGFGKIAKFAGLAGVAGFLTSTLGMSEEQAEEELARDPSKYLELYYRNLNPPTADTNSEEYEAQVRDFVTTNTSEYTAGQGAYAEGGRIGYQDAGPVLPEDPTKPVNPFAPKPTGPVLPDRRMASNMENEKILEALFEKFLDMGLSPEKAAEEAKKEFERMSMMKTEGRGLAALGGRMGFAEAGSAIKDSYDVVEGMDNELNPGLLDKILSSMGVGKFTYGVDEDQGASLIDEIQDYKYGESYPRETISGGKDKYGAVIGPIPKPDRPPMSMEETIEDLEDRWDMAIEEGYEPGKGGEFDYLGIYKKEDIRRRIELGFDQAKASSNSNKIMAAQGGIMNRMNYALGDTASQNAMQAAGIEGLPMRQNPKGVQELDLRDNGGFIPPVGIKEKEDDIPAMLSNNEFVFTADAVRGMGDGNVELGAQRMYDQMKMLEAGGKV